MDKLERSNEEIFDIRPLKRRTRNERILAMESSTVIRFAERRTRQSRISRAMDARRRLAEVEHEQENDDRARGRAWINGLEVGGTDRRFAHLAVFHD
jgi:hypothetical protein